MPSQVTLLSFSMREFLDAAGDLLPTKENILHGLHTVVCRQKKLSGKHVVPCMRALELAPPTIFSEFTNWFTAAGEQDPNNDHFSGQTVLGGDP